MHSYPHYPQPYQQFDCDKAVDFLVHIIVMRTTRVLIYKQLILIVFYLFLHYFTLFSCGLIHTIHIIHMDKSSDTSAKMPYFLNPVPVI